MIHTVRTHISAAFIEYVYRYINKFRFGVPPSGYPRYRASILYLLVKRVHTVYSIEAMEVQCVSAAQDLAECT
jgi:hypothetical protein